MRPSLISGKVRANVSQQPLHLDPDLHTRCSTKSVLHSMGSYLSLARAELHLIHLELVEELVFHCVAILSMRRIYCLIQPLLIAA